MLKNSMEMIKVMAYLVEEHEEYFDKPSRAIAARCFSAFLLEELPDLVQWPQTPGFRHEPAGFALAVGAAGLVEVATGLSSLPGLLVTCFFFNCSVSGAFLL